MIFEQQKSILVIREEEDCQSESESFDPTEQSTEILHLSVTCPLNSVERKLNRDRKHARTDRSCLDRQS